MPACGIGNTWGRKNSTEHRDWQLHRGLWWIHLDAIFPCLKKEGRQAFIVTLVAKKSLTFFSTLQLIYDWLKIRDDLQESLIWDISLVSSTGVKLLTVLATWHQCAEWFKWVTVKRDMETWLVSPGLNCLSRLERQGVAERDVLRCCTTKKIFWILFL